ncbi:hypothetical protein BKA80DRAFT_275424 [Phyllosticta citrichinensis]
MTMTLFLWISALPCRAWWKGDFRAVWTPDLGIRASGYGDCRSGGSIQGAVSIRTSIRFDRRERERQACRPVYACAFRRRGFGCCGIRSCPAKQARKAQRL